MKTTRTRSTKNSVRAMLAAEEIVLGDTETPWRNRDEKADLLPDGCGVSVPGLSPART